MKYKYKNIGKNLRQLRNKLDISQRKAALEMNIEIKAYNKLESENPPNMHVYTLIKILEYYGVTLEELLK